VLCPGQVTHQSGRCPAPLAGTRSFRTGSRRPGRGRL